MLLFLICTHIHYPNEIPNDHYGDTNHPCCCDAEVLKWRAPARSTQIVKAEEEAAAAAERQRAERQRQMALLQEEQLAREQELAEIAPEDNPLPDEVRFKPFLQAVVLIFLTPRNVSGRQEEMRVLESMGWGGPAT
jgi:hypothetical protein